MNRHTSQGVRTLPILLLLAAAAFFAWRGPSRILARPQYNDFVDPYISAKAWLGGSDPYDSAGLNPLWQTVSGDLPESRIAPMYPVSALPLLATIAWLSWPNALYVWVAVNCVAASAMCVGVLRLAQSRISESTGLVVLSAVLAFAPLHTGFANAQVGFFVAALIIIGVWLAHDNLPALAGVVLGAAAALKPPLVIWLLLYFLLTRQSRVWMTAACTGSGLLALGALRLQQIFPRWVQSLQSNAAYWFLPGSVHDYAEGVNRFHLVNLQVGFYALLHSRTAANLLAWALFGAALGIWVVLVRAGTENRLLPIAAISAISLVPMYHRTYDAGVLVLVIVWAASEWRTSRRRLAEVALLCVGAFMLPSAAILSMATFSGRIPANIANSWWWTVVILPHQAWALLALVCVLNFTLWTERCSVWGRQPREDSHTVAATV